MNINIYKGDKEIARIHKVITTPENMVKLKTQYMVTTIGNKTAYVSGNTQYKEMIDSYIMLELEPDGFLDVICGDFYNKSTDAYFMYKNTLVIKKSES